jgi:SRSO17 transposase
MTIDDDLAAWIAGLDDLFALVAARFFRVEPRLRARAYVRGLLAPLASKNGWTLAEAAGDATPDGMQRLLNAAAWDADGVRDDMRAYVAGHLGSPPRSCGGAKAAARTSAASPTSTASSWPCRNGTPPLPSS